MKNLHEIRYESRWWDTIACWMGLHEWSHPGGHCEFCGKCDEMFHEHEICRGNNPP